MKYKFIFKIVSPLHSGSVIHYGNSLREAHLSFLRTCAPFERHVTQVTRIHQETNQTVHFKKFKFPEAS